MARRKQERILLDWFNVSYRTLLLVAAGALVVGGGAVLYLQGFLGSERSPRDAAYAAIREAERQFSEAAALATTPNLEGLREEARGRLERAREAFAESNYSDAMKEAMESRNLSLRLAAIAKGEAGVPDVQFYKIEGHVQVKRARELIWRNANKSSALNVGDQIKTDSNASAQILYFNGTITTIQPGSILEIKELFDDPATRVQKVRETLRTGGTVSSTQEPATDDSFHEISTENASVTARGRSEFETRFDELNRATSVGVYRGGALVRSGEQEVRLADRERLGVDAAGGLSRTERLPPSPSLLEPIDQQIFSVSDGAAQRRNIALRWERLEDQGTYHLQISATSLFGELLLDRRGIDGDSVTLPTEPGSYYWRVAFQDAAGVEGPFSEIRKFKVLAGRVMDSGDTTPPELVIEDFLVFSSQVIVRGRTEPGALLAADGKTVDVGDDGSFTTIIQLRKEGRNLINFVAQDAAGNETKVVRVAEVRSL